MHTTIKPFVICSKNPQRRAHMTAELNRYNLNGIFFDGIYVNDQQLKTDVKDYPVNGLSKGEIGCSLSHIEIYKTMVKEKIPLALIMEDDIKFKENIVSVLKDIEEFDEKTDKPFVYLLTPYKAYVENRKIQLKNVALYEIYRADFAYGYVVNLKAAQRLADYLYPVRFTPDDWRYFKFAAKINVYTAIPEIITSANFKSEVGDDCRIALTDKKGKYHPKLMLQDLSALMRIFSFKFFVRPFLKVKSKTNQDNFFEKMKRSIKKRLH
ncbi:glycosyltransferase family 25 protein [Endomicrobium proavitum]|uniref:Putative beta1,4-galactosyltransferase n=1 Tax=Endomicrobium proavitum TaxID=1408281 RepID=A0A0G3WL81_9BACT|nr:glycosyltransferase family 25 protein [Endomicrobium proavitum]AKL98622.1 putative beta1,4-galactosyltransferase [Endomicrobium proavitum]